MTCFRSTIGLKSRHTTRAYGVGWVAELSHDDPKLTVLGRKGRAPRMNLLF
jgi:hypothetical protein